LSTEERIKAAMDKHAPKEEPLWKGPSDASERGGISFSLLSRFLADRERFRLHVMEGLQVADQFNHRLEYGNMWHACEEATAGNAPWEGALTSCVKRLCQRYPLSQSQIVHWYKVCELQYRIYLAYLPTLKQPQTTPVMSEQVFAVRYQLPSGRTVVMRGKWDAVFLKGKAGSKEARLQENKTKGKIVPGQIVRQLTNDLQTQFYLIALETEQRRLDDSTVKVRLSYRKGQERWFYPVTGVLYNVVRRPLSGGEGTIKQHKPSKRNPTGESSSSFYLRLHDIIKRSPAEYFMRWDVDVSAEERQRFKDRTLDPILEQLCDWWEWVGGCYERGVDVWDNDVSFNGEPWGDGKPHASAIHWQHPFGVYNPLDEGGSSDLDEYLLTGSEAGLQRVGTLFPELGVE
jgi:hypothetical protein